MSGMRIAIVGAGMAGLSCAEALRERGHQPILFDKGRGPGGRMSARRLDTIDGERSFDHGAQYLTARDPGFAAVIEQWAREGHVARWPAGGERAWVGTPAMNAPIRAMAAAADVRWNCRIEALARDAGWRLRGEAAAEDVFDAVVVAVPAEQVAALVADHASGIAAQSSSVPSAPCWTAMAAFAARVAIAQDRLAEIGIIGWAARNASKPGRAAGETWVIQAGPDWSRAHIEDRPEDVLATLIDAFADHVGTALPPALATAAHRWRYARSGALGRDALWDARLRLGVCGDWLLGPRIESAWLSGRGLAAMIGC